jgi:hypothetical protein
MDKGYDDRHIYESREDRDVHPIIPLIQTTGVKRGVEREFGRLKNEWALACALGRARAVPLAA